MLRRRVSLGLAIGCAALGAAFWVSPAPASAADARLTVTPAVYRPAVAGNSGPAIQLVHHGHHGGGYGHHGYGHGGGGYRGYGYGYGYARPYYGGYARPAYGAYYGGYGAYGGYGGYANYGGYRGCW